MRQAHLACWRLLRFYSKLRDTRALVIVLLFPIPGSLFIVHLYTRKNRIAVWRSLGSKWGAYRKETLKVMNYDIDMAKTLKKTRIKLYNTLALPVLLYGSETWTIKARDARRITAAEMKYMRRTAGYIWTDNETNAQISKELKITQILDKLLEYKRNWIQHVNRMPHNRLPRVMKRYSPTGRRNHSRPLKRLLDT